MVRTLPLSRRHSSEDPSSATVKPSLSEASFCVRQYGRSWSVGLAGVADNC